MKELFKALAAFQQEVPVIHKGKEGYGYSFADLPAIFNVINPLLKKHGLGFTQELDGDALVTTIFHAESGEFRTSTVNLIQGVQLKGMNDFQVFGSNLSYMRRYCISAALGLVTDKDTDAAGEQSPKAATKAELPWLNVDSDEWNKVISKHINGQEQGKPTSLAKVKLYFKISKETQIQLESYGIK